MMRLASRVFGILALCAALSLLIGRVDERELGAVEPADSAAYGRAAYLLFDDEEKPDPNVIRMRPEVNNAVKKGLDWLAKNQCKDGIWDAGAYSLPISCMAGLALASYAGPGTGPKQYREAIRKLAFFIIDHADRSGYIFYNNLPAARSRYTDNRPAYGHAFSLLFLTQIYGMGFTAKEQAQIRSTIIGAIKFIEERQSRNGCWYQDYQGGHNMIVTVSHIQALRAANFSGFRVSKAVIKRALKFNEMHVGGGVSPGRNASCTAVLLAAGEYSSNILRKGVKRVLRECRSKAFYQMNQIAFANFVHLYSSQICYFMGGEHWKNYYNNLSRWYLKSQNKDGSWQAFIKVHAVKPSREYTTAVACLILQMPNRYLPMFQAVEPGEAGKRLLGDN